MFVIRGLMFFAFAGLLVATDDGLADDRHSLGQVSRLEIAVEEIDSQLAASWKEDYIKPAQISSDAEFCRRIWLDLAGVAPPVFEVRTFINSRDPKKREALIDRLLASTQHARHMASRARSRRGRAALSRLRISSCSPCAAGSFGMSFRASWASTRLIWAPS